MKIEVSEKHIGLRIAVTAVALVIAVVSPFHRLTKKVLMASQVLMKKVFTPVHTSLQLVPAFSR